MEAETCRVIREKTRFRQGREQKPQETGSQPLPSKILPDEKRGQADSKSGWGEKAGAEGLAVRIQKQCGKCVCAQPVFLCLQRIKKQLQAAAGKRIRDRIGKLRVGRLIRWDCVTRKGQERAFHQIFLPGGLSAQAFQAFGCVRTVPVGGKKDICFLQRSARLAGFFQKGGKIPVSAAGRPREAAALPEVFSCLPGG